MTHQGTLKRPNYRADIDGLRAFAVLSVVAFHAFPGRISGGFVGVDVFFVLSGYLITTILVTNLESGTFRFFEFYSRRIRRIFPALLIMLASCLAYGWFALMPGYYSQLGNHIAAGAGFFTNFLLWHEAGYFDAASATKPLLHLWSLGIEEQFYIVFPVLVWCAYTWRFPVLLLILAMMIPSFILGNTNDITRADAVFYSPVTRFWELLAGGMLACLLPHMQSFTEKAYDYLADDILSVMGLACLALAVFTFTEGGVFPGWRGLLPVFGTMLLIAAGPRALVNRTMLSLRPVVWIGLISYPLYLWHWPLLAYARIQLISVSPGIRLAAIGASIVLAWATYRLVEKPLRFGGNNDAKVKVLCLLMAVMGGIGYYTYYKNGFPGRYLKIIENITTVHFDYESRLGRKGCFAEPTQQNTPALPPQCTDTSKRPEIVLWGDSHAGMLYYGFQKLADNYPLAISEYSGSVCPPLLGYEFSERPYCKTWNDLVIKEIARIKPDYVVLSALWRHYDLSKLQNTTLALKRLHVPKIVLIGQNPLWLAPLSQLLVNRWRQDPQHRIPGQYMWFGVYSGNTGMDDRMRNLSFRLGIDYISAYKKLCNAQGCLTRTGDDANQIAYTDDSHLAPPGSEYFINSIADYFIHPLGSGSDK